MENRVHLQLPVFFHFQEIRSVVVTWEDSPESRCPPFRLLSPQLWLLSTVSRCMGSLSGQFGSDVQAVFSLSSLCTAALLLVRQHKEQRRPWHCVSPAQQKLKLGVRSALFGHESEAWYHMGCYEESQLYPSQNWYRVITVLDFKMTGMLEHNSTLSFISGFQA